jgi:hypothetical protein
LSFAHARGPNFIQKQQPLQPNPKQSKQAELPDLLEALDGASPAAAVPENVARELADVAAIGGAGHLRGVRSFRALQRVLLAHSRGAML